MTRQFLVWLLGWYEREQETRRLTRYELEQEHAALIALAELDEGERRAKRGAPLS